MRRPRFVTCGAPATAARMRGRGQPCDQLLQGLGVDVRVGVGDGDELVARLPEAHVEAVCLAAVHGVADDAATLVAGCRRERGRLGAVGRAVVEDEHLEHRVIDRECGVHAGSDDVLLVEGGNQQGHARPAALGLDRVAFLVQEAEKHAARHPDRRGAHRVERDEREQDLSRGPHSASPRAVRPLCSTASPASAMRNDAIVIRRPSWIAQREVEEPAPRSASAISHMIGPRTSAATSCDLRDAGRSGSKRTDWRSASLLTALR